MEYRNEFDALEAAFDQIGAYVRERIASRLAPQNAVEVVFGSCAAPRSFGCNGKGKVWLQTGNLRLWFDRCCSSDESSIYDHWMSGRDLVLNWQDVKAKLNTELARRDQEHSAIMNFEV